MSAEHKLVCATGMPGAGKSVFSDYFVDKGFQYLRFGQITLDEIQKRDLPINEANEKMVREELREKHGMAAYAVLNYDKFAELLKNGHVIGDGLYSWSEYKYLKEKFGNRLINVAIFAPPEMRHSRLTLRQTTEGDTSIRNRPLTLEEAEKRDYAEIENLEKGGPIAVADFTILNIGTIEEFMQKITEVYEKIVE